MKKIIKELSEIDLDFICDILLNEIALFKDVTWSNLEEFKCISICINENMYSQICNPVTKLKYESLFLLKYGKVDKYEHMNDITYVDFDGIKGYAHDAFTELLEDIILKYVNSKPKQIIDIRYFI